MKWRIALLCVVITIFMVTAYATAGPKFVEEPNIPEGKALVYIFVPKVNFNTPDAGVLANRKHVVALAQGCYFPYITPPGRIDFSVRPVSTRLTLQVEAGQEYFLRIGTGVGRWMLVVVPREQAMSEITECRLLD